MKGEKRDVESTAGDIRTGWAIIVTALVLLSMIFGPSYTEDGGATGCSIWQSWTSSPYSLCGQISKTFQSELVSNLWLIGIATFIITWIIAAVLVSINRTMKNAGKSQDEK